MKPALLLTMLMLTPGWRNAGAATTPLSLTTGKSLVVEVPGGVDRVAVGSGDVLEAVVISLNEVMVNGKAPGETTLLIWPKNGERQIFDVGVQPSPSRVARVRAALQREAGAEADLEVEEETVMLRGTVKDVSQSDRAVAIAGSLGKVVNLLRVAVPAAAPEILLKIRFADIDRSASTEFGVNLLSTGATNTIGSLGTQQFAPPSPQFVQGKNVQFNLSDALNLFLFRPDLDLGATIKALQARNLVQILAEPNLLALAGKEASFLAGGEFSYPVVQSGGGGLNTVTIQFREFGIRIRFIPTITPRGSIRLMVAPEVSALDYANGLRYQGFTVPGLTVRRVSTEIELDSGQSFAIAGLLDNRLAETMTKIPGLGDIPLFGRLFKARSTSRNKSELLVVVTPEVVRPLPAGSPLPQFEMPQPFLTGGAIVTPSAGTPDSAPLPKRDFVPIEELAPPVTQTQPPAAPTATDPPSIGKKKS